VKSAERLKMLEEAYKALVLLRTKRKWEEEAVKRSMEAKVDGE
jgi:hypothetical protein